MQNVLKKITWICLLAVPFLALYVADGRGFDFINWGTSGLYFPFIAGKNLIFRLLVEIAFASWVVLALRHGEYRIDWKKSPLLIAYGIFIIVLFCADLFGVDVYRSFWSNFERMEGFFGHLHFFLYFVVLHGMVRSLSQWRLLLRTHVVANVLLCIWGLGQLFGASGYFFANHLPAKMVAWFSETFPIHMSLNRIDATIGNSAYLAIYCLMFAFIAALLWSQSKSKVGKYIYPALIGINLVLLFYSGTRGTMIGMIVGGLMSLALVAWKEKGQARKVFVGVMLALIVATTALFAFKHSSFVQSSPTLARIASISPGDLTTMSRLSIWKISFEAFKERPLLGYGQDNFTTIFASNFIPSMWNLEPWYDRSHNVFFDWLVAAGVLGLVSYLSLFVVTFYLMWRKKSEMPYREKAIITGALIAYFVHNIFVFDNLTSYIIFFTLIVYVIARTHEEKAHHSRVAKDANLLLLLEPLVVIALIASAYYMVYRPFNVSTLLVRGLDVNRYAKTMSFPDLIKQSQDSFTKAIAAETLGSTEAEEQLMQITPRVLAVTLPDSLSDAERKAALDAKNNLAMTAKNHILAVYETKKNDPRALSIFGNFAASVGDYPFAEKILTQANIIAPRKQLISFDLIKTKIGLGKYQEAFSLGESTYTDDPAFVDSVKWYVISGIYAGKYQETRTRIKTDGHVMPVDGDILKALVSTGQTSSAIALLKEIKTSNPQYAAQVDATIKEILALPTKK